MSTKQQGECMKNNSFTVLVRRPTWGGRISAFHVFCVAAVLASFLSGFGLAQDVPPATITGSGTADFIPRWTGTTTIGNSNIFETVGGDVGIGTTTPVAKLDVKGTGDVRDTLTLFPKLTHPTISVHGTVFAVSNTGKVTFVAGQTFPGAGTVTSVGSGLGLKGGPITSSGSLTIDTAVVPQLGASNTFTGNQSVTGNVTASGQVQGAVVNATTSFDIGGAPFAFSGANGTTFLGFAGNSTSTGTDNTGAGAGALSSNTTGSGEVAFGQGALVSNTSGSDNAAFGTNALFTDATGSFNTAIGVDALFSSTGSSLTCLGFNCTAAGRHIHNATAIGARAMVSASNALVLGSVAGVNGATATVRVGIGTTSPTNLLTLGQGAGPSISDGWTTYSSRRWKTNIQPLHDALGMVELLQGVSYELKDSGKREIGVIAEEVGEVVPEVVSYEENGKDALGVDYSRLTALLIEAVKQQQQQIKTQQQQIARLNGKVEVLEATLQTVQHTGKSPAIVRSSAIKTHGSPPERTKYVGQQGN
jgi:hypothetical protein